MERTQIRMIVQGILETELDSTFGELQDNMVLAQVFKLDSVDYMSLIMRVEETFHIRLSNIELGNVATIGSLLDLVQSKVAGLSSAQTMRRAA